MAPLAPLILGANSSAPCPDKNRIPRVSVTEIAEGEGLEDARLPREDEGLQGTQKTYKGFDGSTH